MWGNAEMCVFGEERRRGGGIGAGRGEMVEGRATVEEGTEQR